MRVTCENCSTKFNLDESLVKDSGSKVRCSKCRHVFTVYPPPAEDEPAEAPAMDLEDQAAFDVPGGPEEDDLGADAGEDLAAADSLTDDDTGSEEEASEDLDLSDIEKMLEIEEPSEIPAAADDADISPEETGAEDAQESLDLSDLEKILDESDDSEELLEEKAEEDQDLVFDIDEDLDLQGAEEQLSPTTELDLGDLEKMFESEEEGQPSLDLEPELEDTGLVLPEVGDDAALEEEMAEGAETELLGFDIDMESEEDEPESEALALDIDLGDETPVEDTDSLSLELEPEGDADAAAEAVMSAEGAEELNLELEPEIEAPAGEAPAEEAEALGLVLESGDDAEAPADGGAAEAPPPLDEEALGEKLEMAFETPEEEAAEAGGEMAEADLTLEADSDEEELAALESDEDVDFPDDAVPDIPDEDEAFVVEDEDAEEAPEEEKDVYEEIAAEENPKGGMKKFLLWILGVLLVIVIALGALIFLQGRGIIPPIPYLDQIQIPFLSGQSVSETDSGNLKIVTSDVDSRFLENDKAGRMFIVTGKVKNEYSEARSYIQVSGSLYTRGKSLADTATAYCGNIIADLELSQMTPAAVRTRLGNRSGDNNANVNVKRGEERPFMIVFFNLPESMEEFTVTVSSSAAAAK